MKSLEFIQNLFPNDIWPSSEEELRSPVDKLLNSYVDTFSATCGYIDNDHDAMILVQFEATIINTNAIYTAFGINILDPNANTSSLLDIHSKCVTVVKEKYLAK